MKRLLLASLLLVLSSVSVLAQDEEDRVAKQTRIAKQSATTTGDRGLFTVPSVETLNRGQYSFGFGWNNTDRTPRDLNVNSYPVYGAYGLFGRLTISAAFETQKQVTAENLAQPGFNAGLPFVRDRLQKGSGDTFLGAKYRILRRRDNIGGLSIRAFLKLPTADAAKGLGTGGTDLGADLIFTSLLPMNFVLHSTMAFTATGDADDPFSATATNFRMKDEMRSGLGFAWPAAGVDKGPGTLQGIFEYSTVTFVGAGSPNAATAKSQNPSDISAGIRYLLLDRGITVDAGYRNNVRFDREFPNNFNRHGMVISIAYTKPVAPPVTNNRFPIIALETATPEVPAGGTTTIVATGFDADNDTLTYTWTTTGGQIAGAGERATFSAAGAATGKYIVHAAAADGKGGIATADLEITVRP